MTKTASPDTLLVCNCQRTMEIDGKRLAAALGVESLPVRTELCRGERAHVEAALAGEGRICIACTQEAPLFRETAEEKGVDAARLTFTNIRERAGWSEAKGAALPKMAALLAEAGYAERPASALTLKSEGVCLVYGRGQAAADAAQALAGRLSVTLLLKETADVLPPPVIDVPILSGRIRTAKGHLGAFEIEVDGYAPYVPSSRRALAFVMPRDGARSQCDVIVDLTGDAALFPGGGRRDGYLRADPADPAAVARALLAASDLVGEFEKPQYVAYDKDICAHSRSRIVGCRNCLDACPLGAITPLSDADHVVVDPAVCGGCGSCSAVCPTGAASYAYPRREDLLARAQILLKTYRRAGGTRPFVLLHDERHGTPIVSAMARLGRGLPAHVLPLQVHSVQQAGHDILLGMLASGAEQIAVFTSPEHRDEIAPLAFQVEVAEAFLKGLALGAGRIQLLVEADPDAVEAALYAPTTLAPLKSEPFAPVGGKRDIARAAIAKLADAAPAPPGTLALPKGAPYGRVNVRTEGCTLCLSCVGACPTGALTDNPDRPQLSFTESACVQCGICAATCPEKVITLEPRYSLEPAALAPAVVKVEEPFHCVSCGKAFGTKSTVERVVRMLEGKHAMFRNPQQVRLIQMCETCRVVAVAEDGNDPLRVGERPRVRTTDDYLAERAKKKPGGGTPDDFIS